MPLLDINYQKSENLSLDPYSTTTFKYHFYFPKEGEFVHFPSNVSISNTVVAVSNIKRIKVVAQISEIVVETFKDILMTGENKAVFEFLKSSNLLQDKKGFSFEQIYWMLKEKPVYEEIIRILRERRIYVHQVWQFAFYHCDEVAVKEYVSKSEYMSNILGSNFSSKLYDNHLTKDKPRHLEYYPLINSRAHNLGDDHKTNIMNNEFRRQYDAFLMNQIEKPTMKVSDKLCFTYFLLLQDRIQEALDTFREVDKDDLPEDGSYAIQYDYMAAYLDIFFGINSNYKIAREIVKNYINYPVVHWRVLFDEIREQFEEFDGDVEMENEAQEDDSNFSKNYKKSKDSEPTLHAELKQKRILIDYDNISHIEIKYYLIDPEILFSRTPFLYEDTEDLAFVQPSLVQPVELNTNQNTTMVNIEKSLVTSNIIIEVSGANKQVFMRYFSTSLKVILNETYGELKVNDIEGNAMAEAYIKVFARHNGGKVKFFRDGYTDLNGRYEYAQINSKSLKNIERFSIFVSRQDYGSVTKE